MESKVKQNDRSGTAARNARASEEQKLELIKYFEANPDALAACSSSAAASSEYGRQKQRTWIELAHKLNAIEGTLKPSMKWARYWSDLTVNTKILARNFSCSSKDAPRPRAPTHIEERMLRVIGQGKLLGEWQVMAAAAIETVDEVIVDEMQADGSRVNLRQMIVVFQLNVIIFIYFIRPMKIWNLL